MEKDPLPPTRIGALIQAMRRLRGMSREELSKATGLFIERIKDIEIEQFVAISDVEKRVVADALNLNYEELCRISTKYPDDPIAVFGSDGAFTITGDEAKRMHLVFDLTDVDLMEDDDPDIF